MWFNEKNAIKISYKFAQRYEKMILTNQALDTKVIGSTIVLYNILGSKGVSTILNDIYSLVNFT